MPSPPKFADIGKKVRDLFKKNYDFNSSLKVTQKGSPLAVETNVSLPVDNGKSKLTYKEGSYEVEATVASNGKHGLTTTLKDLMPDLELKFDLLNFSVDETYTAIDGVTLTGSLDLNQNLNAAAVANVSDGLNVGASVSLGFAKEDVLTDYNFGAEYKTGDVTLSFATNDKLQGNTLSFLQKVDGGVLGLDVASDANGSRSIRVGGECACDDMTVRGKINDKGIFSTSVTTIFDPRIKVTAAGQFDIFADDIAPKEIGFAFQLGDY
jgi:hypothetical protein